MKKFFLFLFTFCLIANTFAQKDTPIYSFFSAGHTYGMSTNPHYGLHYPFVDYIQSINNYPNLEMGFFTGDIVYHNTSDYWDSAQIDMEKFNMPLYLAAGNHDFGQEFVNRFGDYYYSFVQNNDLFIILTPRLNNWYIIGKQLEFLTNTLNDNYTTVNNIFIFLHELIWWSPTNEYQNVIINYNSPYPGSNYEEDLKPLFLSFPNPITLYAGDLGGATHVSSVMYHHYDNITLIGSGMGNEINDNIIITDVYQDSVHYNLIAINGDDPNALGDIEDYSIISSSKRGLNEESSIYPNPADYFIHIKTPYSFIEATPSVFVHNILGHVIDEFILYNTNTRIDISQYPSGLYFFVIKDGENILENHKVVIE